MLPEIILVGTAFLVLIWDLLFLNRGAKWLVPMALVGVFCAALVAWTQIDQTGEAFGGRFGIDPATTWFKLIFLVAGFLTISLTEGLKSLAEFLTVLLFTLTGMLFLASSRDLISLYVSLETATIPLFLLTAWSRTARSGEAGLKYVIMGALASAFLLYGLGLLYGISGAQTSLSAIAHDLKASGPLWFAAGLVLAGVGFKLTLFPFHMWGPDAYEGAPTPVTAYLSVASKAAGLVLAFQILYRIFGAFLPQWSMGIAVLAAATMTLGNVVAILQRNIKRFMAFSAISQAGYLILGFLGHTGADASTMIFYLLVYVFTNLAAFAVISLHVQQTGSEEIVSFRGFSKSNPVLALALLLALFGLAGIPPLAGFVGKFFLFSVAAQAGLYWLVAVAAVNSTVSLYYYLRIVRQMYIEPGDSGRTRLKASPVVVLGLVLATTGLVVLGLIPTVFEKVSMSSAQWIAHW